MAEHTTPSATAAEAPAPIDITAEAVADYLRWRLSNHNFELGEFDAAADTADHPHNPAALLLAVTAGTVFGAPPPRRSGAGHFVITVQAVTDADIPA